MGAANRYRRRLDCEWIFCTVGCRADRRSDRGRYATSPHTPPPPAAHQRGGCRGNLSPKLTMRRLQNLLCAIPFALALSAAHAQSYWISGPGRTDVNEGDNFDIEFHVGASRVPTTVAASVLVARGDCRTVLNSSVVVNEFQVGTNDGVVGHLDWCSGNGCQTTVKVWGTTVDNNCHSGRKEFGICIEIVDAHSTPAASLRQMTSTIYKHDDDTSSWQGTCD